MGGGSGLPHPGFLASPQTPLRPLAGVIGSVKQVALQSRSLSARGIPACQRDSRRDSGTNPSLTQQARTRPSMAGFLKAVASACGSGEASGDPLLPRVEATRARVQARLWGPSHTMPNNWKAGSAHGATLRKALPAGSRCLAAPLAASACRWATGAHWQHPAPHRGLVQPWQGCRALRCWQLAACVPGPGPWQDSAARGPANEFLALLKSCGSAASTT